MDAIVDVNSDAEAFNRTLAKTKTEQFAICSQIVLQGAGNEHAAGSPHETVEQLLRPPWSHLVPIPNGGSTLNANTITRPCTTVTASSLRTIKSIVLRAWN
jgi:hypothetical protein